MHFSFNDLFGLIILPGKRRKKGLMVSNVAEHQSWQLLFSPLATLAVKLWIQLRVETMFFICVYFKGANLLLHEIINEARMFDI